MTYAIVALVGLSAAAILMSLRQIYTARKPALRPPLSIVSWRYDGQKKLLADITAKDSTSNEYRFSKYDGQWESEDAEVSDYIVAWLESESGKLIDDDSRNSAMWAHVKGPEQ